jgi:competence protein ComEA
MISPDWGAKKWIFLCSGMACFLAVFIIAAMFRGKFAVEEEIVPSPVNFAQTQEEISHEPVHTKWAVYVTGEVKFPGMYEIEPGGRVNDAVMAAGGFSERADRESVNLAAKLQDEAHISVAPTGENPPAGTQKTVPAPSARGEKTYGVSYPGSGAASEKELSKMDLNRANAEDFATLPGIGPKLSAAIVAYRDENGPFGSVDELRSVGGIGEKRFEAIRELVTVSNR